MKLLFSFTCFFLLCTPVMAEDKNIEMNKEIVTEFTQCAGLLFALSSKEKAINGENAEYKVLDDNARQGVLVASLYSEGTGETSNTIGYKALYLAKNLRGPLTDSSKKYAYGLLKDECTDMITNATKYISEKKWKFGLTD